MRVLLTGASGYLGAHVLGELLATGHAVTALVRSRARLGPLAARPGVTVRVGDLDDDALLGDASERHEACVHAALLWGEPGSELQARDTAVAARLFEGAGRAGVVRSVYVSSAAVHRPFSPWMTEDDPIVTADAYGATKAAGELFLRAACASYGMRGVVLRPGPIVGPPAFPGGALRSDGRIERMVADAVAGRAVAVPFAEGRQLVDVVAVARATARVLAVADPHPTYLCMDAAVTPWADVARLVAEAVGGAAVAGDVAGAARVARDGGAAGESPRFSTTRIAELLGGPLDARAALRAHVAVLVERAVAAGAGPT